MKRNLSLTLICSLALIAGCTKQEYYNIPVDANGHAVITQVATVTSSGISTLDDQFTVNATFPNAKAGDVMKVELLQLQVPPQGGTATQLLPLAGTLREATLGSDLKASVTYTRSEAKMNVSGNTVTVTFAGKTDAAKLTVNMVQATSVGGLQFGGKEVNLIRSAGTAFFEVKVAPKLAAYTGSVIVQRKNGANAPWVNVGSFASLASVPVSGDDFAIGKDTMYYSFVAQKGIYADQITTQIIANNPYFFLKKTTGTLSLVTSAQGGLNLLVGSSVTADATTAIISVSGGSLIVKGGAAWAVSGKSITFVPSTIAMYDNNNSADAITAYAAGTPAAIADPANGEGVFIFKIITGIASSNVYYGMIKVGTIVPGVSVSFEYRIGNIYPHVLVIK